MAKWTADMINDYSKNNTPVKKSSGWTADLVNEYIGGQDETPASLPTPKSFNQTATELTNEIKPKYDFTATPQQNKEPQQPQQEESSFWDRFNLVKRVKDAYSPERQAEIRKIMEEEAKMTPDELWQSEGYKQRVREAGPVASGFYKGSIAPFEAVRGIINTASGLVGGDSNLIDEPTQFKTFKEERQSVMNDKGFVQNLPENISQIITEMLPAIATGGNTGLAYMGTQAGGRNAQSALDDGATAGQAAIFGAGTGLAEALTERLGFIPGLGSAFVKGMGKNFAKNLGKTAIDFGKKSLQEGLEEIIMEPTTGLLQKVTYQPDKQIFGQGGVIDPMAMAESGALGTIVGGLMGGAQIPSGMTQARNAAQSMKGLDSIINTAMSMPTQSGAFMTAQAISQKAQPTYDDYVQLVNEVRTDMNLGLQMAQSSNIGDAPVSTESQFNVKPTTLSGKLQIKNTAYEIATNNYDAAVLFLQDKYGTMDIQGVVSDILNNNAPPESRIISVTPEMAFNYVRKNDGIDLVELANNIQKTETAFKTELDRDIQRLRRKSGMASDRQTQIAQNLGGMASGRSTMPQNQSANVEGEFTQNNAQSTATMNPTMSSYSETLQKNYGPQNYDNALSLFQESGKIDTKELSKRGNMDLKNAMILANGVERVLGFKQGELTNGTQTIQDGTLGRERKADSVSQESKGSVNQNENASQLQKNIADAIKTNSKDTDVSGVKVVEEETAIQKSSREFINTTLGLDVVFFEGAKDAPNGFYRPEDTNRLYINADNSDTAIVRAVSHESFHALKKNDPEKWNELIDYLTDNLDQKQLTDYANTFSNQEYTKFLLNNQKLLVEEIAADEFANNFTSKTWWEELYNKNASLFKKLMYYVNKLLDKVNAVEAVENNYLTVKQAKAFAKKQMEIMESVMRGKDVADTNVRKNTEQEDDLPFSGRRTKYSGDKSGENMTRTDYAKLFANQINWSGTATREIQTSEKQTFEIGEIINPGVSWTDGGEFRVETKGKYSTIFIITDSVSGHQVDYENEEEVSKLDADGSEYEKEILINQNFEVIDFWPWDAETEYAKVFLRSAPNIGTFDAENPDIRYSGRRIAKDELAVKIELQDILTDELKNAKDPKGLFAPARVRLDSAQRVFERYFGKDSKAMKILQTGKTAEADMIRWQSETIKKIKDLGIKSNLYLIPGKKFLSKISKESQALMWYAEKMKGLDPYGIDELKADLPETWEKIVKAEKVLRDIYDSTIKLANEKREALGYPPIPFRKNYVAHMQQANGLFEMFGVSGSDIPTAIVGMTDEFEPWKPFFANEFRRVTNETEVDAIGNTIRYINGIGRMIYMTEYINSLRMLEKGVRENYSQHQVITEIEKINDLMVSKEQMGREKFKKYYEEEKELTSNKPVMRNGRPMTENARQKRLEAVREMKVKAINETNEALKGMKERKDKFEELLAGMSKEGDSATHLSVLAGWLKEYTNLVAGKNARIDRITEELVRRKGYSIYQAIDRQLSSAYVGYNVGSATTNVIPLVNALSQINKISVAKGLFDTIRYWNNSDGMVEKSDFLSKRLVDTSFTNTMWGKAIDYGFLLMRLVDKFTASTVLRAKYYEGLSQGKTESEAMKQADISSEKLMADRSSTNIPVLFKSKIANLIVKFQLEQINNLQNITTDNFKADWSKDPGKLGKQLAEKNPETYNVLRATYNLLNYLALAYVMNLGFLAILGRKPVFDLIGLFQDLMKIFGDKKETEGEKTWKAVKKFIEQIPLAQTITGGRIPLSGALPNVEDIIRGRAAVSTELKKPAKLLFPGGGGQISKTIEGIKTVKEGGYYKKTPSGEALQYSVEKTPVNAAKAAVFGRSSLKESREFYENGERGLSAKQTIEQKSIGVNPEEYLSGRELQAQLGKAKTRVEKETIKTDIVENYLKTNNPTVFIGTLDNKLSKTVRGDKQEIELSDAEYQEYVNGIVEFSKKLKVSKANARVYDRVASTLREYITRQEKKLFRAKGFK